MMSHHLVNTKQYAKNLPRRIIISYVLDWLLILIIAILGGIFHWIKNGNRRPFALQNPNIAFPRRDDTVSPSTLILLSLFLPAGLSAIICLVSPFVNVARRDHARPRNQVWRKALLELHHTWLGLFLALATAFMITEGLKDLAGKPRPHMLAVCRPDLSSSSISANQVGGLDQAYNSETGATPILVSSSICSETDQAKLRDAFASWPSGHSSFSMAGLVYLALFLCGKFYVRLPFVGTWIQRGARDWQAEDANGTSTRDSEHTEAAIPLHQRSQSKTNGQDVHNSAPFTDDSAAAALDNNSEPPLYLALLCLYVPVGLALFICVSRWFDFHHHGIDIFSGAVIGIICATMTFWWFYVLGGLGRKRTLRFGVSAAFARTSRAAPDWRERHSSEAAIRVRGPDAQPEVGQVNRAHDWA